MTRLSDAQVRLLAEVHWGPFYANGKYSQLRGHRHVTGASLQRRKLLKIGVRNRWYLTNAGKAEVRKLMTEGRIATGLVDGSDD